MSMVPFTAAPLWVSVSDTGTNTPPVPALPVHVPARLAVGALSSAFSARQAAPPAARTLNRARSTIVGVFIMVSSFAREPIRVGPHGGVSRTLWRLAEVVDVPVDHPRSIGQQRTQVHDRLSEMALGTLHH